jgi:hypothetical protein
MSLHEMDDRVKIVGTFHQKGLRMLVFVTLDHGSTDLNVLIGKYSDFFGCVRDCFGFSLYDSLNRNR